ncbi:MAG: MFS transporter [Pseudomonadota bacterium]
MNRPQLTALIVASALFMENVDSTVIATALPVIAADIGSDPIRLKLALTAYLLSLATFIPISGWAADRFGARVVFRCAIGVFIVGSICCSLATSLTEFVLARVLQGAGGAMMTPIGRLVILRATPKSQLLSAMAWLTIPALMGPVIGPPLGGFIATYFDWRWIFWINVPVGFLGIAMVTIFIDDIRGRDPGRLDVRGFFLSAIGLSGLVFGLSVLGQNMMPLPISLTMIGVGAVACVVYVVHSRRTAAPILDLSLLRIPTFYCGAVGGLFFRIGIGSIPFLLPLTLQVGLGLSAFEAGSLTFLSAAGALLMKFTTLPIVARFGFRTTLLWNGFICSVSVAAMSILTFNPPAIVMVSILLLGGYFRSLQFTCLNTMAYAEVEQARMSSATSFFSVAQQVSLALGVAVGAAVVELQRAARPGHEILASDFFAAFATVSALSLVALFFYARLQQDAAAEVAGGDHAARKPVAST